MAIEIIGKGVVIVFSINRPSIETQTRLTGSKANKGTTNLTVFQGFHLVMCNLVEKLRDFSIYDMGHWSTFVDRWINNQNYYNNNVYNRGEIVMVDLGSANFRHEPSYTHPCVIIAARKHNILVAPGSTKKYASGYYNIIDAPTTPTGFARDTGIQMEGVRWVHKNRVISGPSGKVDSGIMRKIDEYLIQLNVTVQNRLRLQQDIIKNRDAEISQLKSDIGQLQSDKHTLSVDKLHLETAIEQKDNTIEVLKKKEALFDESKKILKQFKEHAEKTGLFTGQTEMKKLLEKLAE